MILHHSTLTDFVITRFDRHGPWKLLSATKEGVSARRPRAGHQFFTWREWFEMSGDPENSLQLVLAQSPEPTP